MKIITLIIILACQIVRGDTENADLAVLLTQISKICGDRWDIDLDDENRIDLESKETSLGEAAGYNFRGGEDQYILRICFKIVEAMDAKAISEARSELKNLREKGHTIKHDHPMEHYRYTPVSEDQWALVVLIRKAERKVKDIPEYRFKSVCLSEEYSMKFFIPNKKDSKAVQYKRDMDGLYKLLRKMDSEQPGSAQPTTQPADKPPVNDQPSTPTSKGGLR